MRKTTMIIMVSLLFLNLFADEAIDAMARAKEFYNKANYSKATYELNYAINQIQQKQIEHYKSAFPKPLNDWVADDFSNDSGGMNFVGGGLALSRKYHKGDSFVEISIVSDSPLLSGVMMMFKNPMFLGANKLVTINGERAIEVVGSNGTPKEIQFVIDGHVLINVHGYQCTKDELYSFAKSIALGKM